MPEERYAAQLPCLHRGLRPYDRRIWGLGFRVEGLGFRVEGLGFRVVGVRIKV